MSIPDTLKQELFSKFKTEKKIENIIKNKQIYYFEHFNTNQIQKIFGIENQKIFSETNSKKHLTKILDMIKNNFFNKKTNHYLTLLNPTNFLEKYNKRKKAFEKIKTLEVSKEIISKIELLKTNIVFNNRILTLESHIEKFFYENYKIHTELVNKKELEIMFQEENLENAIIVTEEDLFVEIPTFPLKEFQKIIVGNIIKTNTKQILNLIELYESQKEDYDKIKESANNLADINLEFNIDFEKLKTILFENNEEVLKELTNKTLRLEEEVETINKELKTIISQKQLSLQGDELLELLNSGDMGALQKKFKQDVEEIVNKKEKEILNEYKKCGINIDCLFSNPNYPLLLDEDAKETILSQIDFKGVEMEIELFKRLGNFDYNSIKKLWDFAFYLDFYQGIAKFFEEYSLKYPKIGNGTTIVEGKNIYIKNAMPITYGIGTKTIEIRNTSINLKTEKVAILTGANSGGKTTLLEMFLQSQILTSMGLGISASEKSCIKLQEEVIYLKKFTGTQGSGAFEQTIRNLIEIIDTDTEKLLLIDEFEAITEPGAAARILINFLKELTNQNTFCIGVSHLGQEILEFVKEEKITGIRIDGISAEGLDNKGNLITNHQPRFYELGKSTPELILKRILQDEKFWTNKSENSKKLLEKISK